MPAQVKKVNTVAHHFLLNILQAGIQKFPLDAPYAFHNSGLTHLFCALRATLNRNAPIGVPLPHFYQYRHPRLGDKSGGLDELPKTKKSRECEMATLEECKFYLWYISDHVRKNQPYVGKIEMQAFISISGIYYSLFDFTWALEKLL